MCPIYCRTEYIWNKSDAYDKPMVGLQMCKLMKYLKQITYLLECNISLREETRSLAAVRFVRTNDGF